MEKIARIYSLCVDPVEYIYKDATVAYSDVEVANAK